MTAPVSPKRHPRWLLAAAAASLAGGAALLGMGRVAEGVAAPAGGGPAALGLLSLVILLVLGGLVLAAMAVKELRDQERLSHLA
jgi:hypothetical protein